MRVDGQGMPTGVGGPLSATEIMDAELAGLRKKLEAFSRELGERQLQLAHLGVQGLTELGEVLARTDSLVSSLRYHHTKVEDEREEMDDVISSLRKWSRRVVALRDSMEGSPRDAGEAILLERLPEVWETRDGRTLLIAEMHDEHLRNALAIMDRRIAAEVEGQAWRDPRDPLDEGSLTVPMDAHPAAVYRLLRAALTREIVRRESLSEDGPAG